MFFRQLLFIGVLIFVGLIVFKQLSFFIGAFLGAVTIYMVLRGLQFRLTGRYRWKGWLSSFVLVMGVSLILLGISFFVFEMIAKEIPAVDASQLMVSLSRLPQQINDALGFDVIPADILQRSEGLVTSLLSSVFNTTYSFAANVFLMMVILYFMLTAGRRMEKHLLTYSPFKGNSLELLKKELKSMIYSNAVGLPVILVVQAALSTLIYWILGVHNFFFWGFLTGICGLLPLVGTGLVWLPLSVYLLFTGHIWAGIILALFGVVVIGNSDNLIRIGLMKRGANTHPLIVIFGVMLGIPLFGFWGIIFGPLFLSVFLLLLKIYYVEYGLLPETEASPEENDIPGR